MFNPQEIYIWISTSSKSMAEKFMEGIKENKFEKCVKDGCLFRRKDEIREVIIFAYVDDMLIVRDEMAVDKTHEELRKAFTIVVEEAKEFLRCKWIESEKGYVIHQAHVLKKLADSFSEEVKEMKEYIILPSGESYR